MSAEKSENVCSRSKRTGHLTMAFSVLIFSAVSCGLLSSKSWALGTGSAETPSTVYTNEEIVTASESLLKASQAGIIPEIEFVNAREDRTVLQVFVSQTVIDLYTPQSLVEKFSQFDNGIPIKILIGEPINNLLPAKPL